VKISGRGYLCLTVKDLSGGTGLLTQVIGLVEVEGPAPAQSRRFFRMDDLLCHAKANKERAYA
jgi:hypothetical protein